MNSNVIFYVLDMDVLDCGPHTETAWKTAFKKFEFLLQPAEERVAIKLKNQLSNMNTNTRQVINILQKALLNSLKCWYFLVAL